MLTGSNTADSTMTSVVASVISDDGAAHDPGDPEDRLRIGDEQRVGIELALDVIERLEALARPCQAHDDPPVVHGRGIEGVDRLAELQHHVVADVDDVADRPLAGGDEAHLDPIRATARP